LDREGVPRKQLAFGHFKQGAKKIRAEVITDPYRIGDKGQAGEEKSCEMLVFPSLPEPLEVRHDILR